MPPLTHHLGRRVTYTAVRMVGPDLNPATSIQSGYQEQYRRSGPMSIRTLTLRDTISCLPRPFTLHAALSSILPLMRLPFVGSAFCRMPRLVRHRQLFNRHWYTIVITM